MSSMKKTCAAALAALLLVTGCSANDKAWVFKSGDIAPPAGVYISYLITGMSNAVGQLTEEGVTGASAMPVDELLKQTVSGQPADQWVTADAGQALREYIAVEQQFAAEGVALPEGARQQVESTVAGQWAELGALYEDNGVAQSSMELSLLNDVKRSALFSHYYDEGGKTPVPEDEIKAILTADYAKLRFMPFAKVAANPEEGADDAAVEAAETAAEEENAALRQKADDYVKRVTDGEDLLDLIMEYEKETSGATDEDRDTYDTTSLMILNESLSGTYYSEELVTGAMKIPVGETQVIEDDNFYYVLNRLDILEDPADLADIRGTILTGLKGEEFTATVEGWAAALTVETNQPALSHYTPGRLKLE